MNATAANPAETDRTTVRTGPPPESPPNSGPGRPEWLLPEEVAELLRLTKDQVLSLIQAGRIPATRLNRKHIRVNAERLARVLAADGGN